MACITTELGRVKGIKHETYLEFYGIPFAQPPVGALRWASPLPPEPWEGTLDATGFAPMAMQPDIRTDAFWRREFYDDDRYFPGQSEDCLYLNVWCPPDVETAHPVAVWIHGGAFDHGYAFEKEFDGRGFAERGVVLVSIAYRVDAFGFLAVPGGDGAVANANFGLQDQLAALRWVHRHVAAFGGDPERVTVFGQSAGAMSCELLCGAPETRGLFGRAILQSGAGMVDAFGGIRPQADALALTARLLRELGCADVDEARRRTSQEVLEASRRATAGTQGLRWCPVADGPLAHASQEERMREVRAKRLDVIAGATSDDIGAAPFANPAFDGAHAFASQASPRSWAYLFAHALPGSTDGAFHSSELWYTFGTFARSWRPMSEEDALLSAQMLDRWCAFVRDGDPNVQGCEPWPRAETGRFLRFE